MSLPAIGRRLSLLVIAATVVILVRTALLLLSYHRIKQAIPRTGVESAPLAMCGRIAHAVVQVARFVPGATCLTQAFAVQWMLALRGYPSEIQIGVAPNDDGGMRAHAWLLSDSHIIIGGQAEDLSRFQSLTKIVVRKT